MKGPSDLVKLSKRLISNEEIGKYKLSRGNVGRKIFEKGWKHMSPRFPINLQERWHRASVERLFHPSIIENLNTNTIGEKDTLEYRMFFKSNNINIENNNNDNNNDYNFVSPWHDIPLGFKTNNNNEIYFNYINEISKNDRAKMECCLNEKWNPIKQDVKKGALRYFKYGDLPFNYGFISQTWEDPNVESKYSDVKGLKGDGDPIDVVEISNNPLPRGIVTPIKVIGVLGLIDEGETDWKIIGINASDPNSKLINNMKDASNILNVNYDEIILDWFRNYKIPDGKPANEFSHSEKYNDSSMAIEIIEECHRHWYDLILGARKEDKIELTSITQKYLMAQGLTSNHDIGELPTIEYPRYDDWKAEVTTKPPQNVDNSIDDFDLDEEAPDQRKI